VELREIARDVWACLQKDEGLGCSNSGLLNRGGGLVVDTFWDLPRTRALIAAYARVWKAPARQVVNTHENGDHCWGNQLFEGAEILAQRACAEAFGRHESPAALQALRAQTSSPDPALASLARRLAPFDFSGIELRAPTRTFDDRLELDLGGLAVHLIHVGPAHTAGDAIVHVPERGVLFAGDVLFRLCTPIGWAGTFAGWAAALDRIVALAPDVIVPGHGPLCGVEGALEMKAYLAFVRGEARRHFEAGRTVLEAAERIDLGPYAGWTEPERLVFQVERAYRELRGEAWDAPLDAPALLRSMYALSERWRHGAAAHA
jgi:glyoxylase-like metal-dependent hydrolase (beta-lactamase superfamily II)